MVKQKEKIDLKPIKKSSKDLKEIISYLEENEDVFIHHYTKNHIKRISKFAIPIFIISLVFYFITLILRPDILYYFTPFFYPFALFMILAIIINLLTSNKRFFFTGERLLVWYKKQLSQTSYDNIDSVNYAERIKYDEGNSYQDIKITLKQPFEGNYQPKNLVINLISPSKLDLFQKIKSLVNT